VVVQEAWIDHQLLKKTDHNTKRKEQLRKVKSLEETIREMINVKEDLARNRTKIHTTTSTTQELSLNQKECQSLRTLKFLHCHLKIKGRRTLKRKISKKP
jgi:hypothetical protein